MSDNTNRTHIDRPDEHHFNGDAPPNSYDLSEVKEVDQKIELSYGTKACCTECGREDAPYLFLKKSNGLYELLCKDFDGSGCWPQSSRTLCNYSDYRSVQCTQLAEFKVQCGADPIRNYYVCKDHIGMFLQSYSVYKVYPLDKD